MSSISQIGLVVHAGDVQHRDSPKRVLAQATLEFHRLRVVRTDAGYAGRLVDWGQTACSWSPEIIRRTCRGLEVPPK